MSNDLTVAVIDITDDNRADFVKLAMLMYLGEKCKYCGRTYATLADLEDTVLAGEHAHGRLACEACWKANNPS